MAPFRRLVPSNLSTYRHNSHNTLFHSQDTHTSISISSTQPPHSSTTSLLTIPFMVSTRTPRPIPHLELRTTPHLPLSRLLCLQQSSQALHNSRQPFSTTSSNTAILLPVLALIQLRASLLVNSMLGLETPRLLHHLCHHHHVP
jgi:hypothetical protein